MVYGFCLAIISISSFAGIIYGYYDGQASLGMKCNESWSESCEPVFRTRAVTFCQLTWCLLVLAWEMIDMRRSLFKLTPGAKWTNVFHDLYRNQLLFWSAIFGFVSAFPVAYIPVINRDVFKHCAPTWEWAVAVAGLFLYFGVCEAWKFAKRCYFRLEESSDNKGSV